MCGVKAMKDKNRITIMVCISATGQKVPLSVVGKAHRPQCWDLCDNKPPISYTSQSNAWFDRKVTKWWINEVFVPFYQKHFGTQKCVLILDNWPAHKDLNKGDIPEFTILKFLPPNGTSRYQPADQGIIAMFKLGYKLTLLSRLLSICDDPRLYAAAKHAGNAQRKGCRGINYAGKPHILDAMNILDEIWKAGTYVSPETIVRCWRKSQCLPVLEQCDIVNEVARSDKNTKQIDEAHLTL